MPELITFNPDVIGPPQALAECGRCGKLNRWALRVWTITDDDGKTHDLIGYPESIERCYHCHELFSPQWRAENWAPSGW